MRLKSTPTRREWTVFSCLRWFWSFGNRRRSRRFRRRRWERRWWWLWGRKPGGDNDGDKMSEAQRAQECLSVLFNESSIECLILLLPVDRISFTPLRNSSGGKAQVDKAYQSLKWVEKWHVFCDKSFRSKPQKHRWNLTNIYGKLKGIRLLAWVGIDIQQSSFLNFNGCDRDLWPFFLSFIFFEDPGI